ncbi:MAG: hypothetical protein ACE5FH_13265 [Candidatus Zixiibacteriota bacterium]
MKLITIDPGTENSGWVILDGMEIVRHGINENKTLLYNFGPNYSERSDAYPDELVIEMVSHYGSGMPAGASVFETCIWIGRFEQKWRDNNNTPPHRLFRRDVKLWLCDSVRAKDANVRQAVIDRYPPTGKDGKGRPSAIGTKAHPGPLYGVSSHEWAALALGITFNETREQEQAND